MEITKDININTDNLISDSNIIISYSGKLCNSNKVFINFGHTPNSFQYQKAELSENKEIKIEINKPGYFYFYFNDELGNIDNNNYKDYQLYIKQSALILTDNSSMKELPYRFVKESDYSENFYKTFYTSQTIKNTSRPQEIIIPRAFNSMTASNETKNINGYRIEPVKHPKTYELSQSLLPTDNLSLITTTSSTSLSTKFHKFNLALNKIILAIPKLFGKDYS